MTTPTANVSVSADVSPESSSRLAEELHKVLVSFNVENYDIYAVVTEENREVTQSYTRRPLPAPDEQSDA